MDLVAFLLLFLPVSAFLDYLLNWVVIKFLFVRCKVVNPQGRKFYIFHSFLLGLVELSDTCLAFVVH